MTNISWKRKPPKNLNKAEAHIHTPMQTPRIENIDIQELNYIFKNSSQP